MLNRSKDRLYSFATAGGSEICRRLASEECMRLRKKHPEASVRWLLRHRQPSRHRPTRRVWQGERHEQYQMGWLKVQRYKRRWMTPPDFTVVPGEPDA